MPTLVEKKIIKARISLIRKEAFFGNLIMRMPLIPLEIPRAAGGTDGVNIFYSPAAFEKCTVEEIEFILLHEIHHVIQEFFDRLKQNNYHAKLWNCATDYNINVHLINTYKYSKPVNINLLYDEKYLNDTSDEIYRKLIEEIKKQNSSNESGQGNPTNKEIDDYLQSLGDNFDEHEFLNKASEKEGGKQERERQILRNIKESAMAAGKDTPEHIKRAIDKLNEPKIDWREYLMACFTSKIKNDFTYARLNRKSYHMDAILPGYNVENSVNVAIAIDVSGSISEKEIKSFMSEVKGLMDQFNSFVLNIWSFDTKIMNHKKFTQDEKDQLINYAAQITGGGGTLFDINWDFMKSNDIFPDTFVMMTDGYPADGFGDPFYADTIWLIDTDVIAPHGITIPYTL